MSNTLFDPPTPIRPPSSLDTSVAQLINAFGFDRVERALGKWKIEHGGPIPSAPARFEDPRTSQAQGRKMGDVRRFSAKSHAGKLLREWFVSGEKGLTDHAATAIVVGEEARVAKFEGCRRRCSDLRAAGYIDDTGKEDEGRIIWAITPSGCLAFSRMKRDGWSRGPVMKDDDDPVEAVLPVEGLQ